MSGGCCYVMFCFVIVCGFLFSFLGVCFKSFSLSLSCVCLGLRLERESLGLGVFRHLLPEFWGGGPRQRWFFDAFGGLFTIFYFLHHYTPPSNSILIFLSFFPFVGFFFPYNSLDMTGRGVKIGKCHFQAKNKQYFALFFKLIRKISLF